MMSNTSGKYIHEVRFKDIANWSAATILRNNLLFKEGFTLEPVGSLLTRNRTKEVLEDDHEYMQVTVKLYGKGVIQRGEELVPGKHIRTKNQYRVSEGQFIMSKIDARNGAFGIVPPELDGAITTQDFLSYNINTDKVHPQFFVLITASKRFYELCQQASSGTTGRQRIDEKAFLGFEIPVPNLELQNRLINEYNKLYHEAELLKQKIKDKEVSIEKLLDQYLGIKQNTQKTVKRFNLVSFKEIKEWGVDQILKAKTFQSSKFKTTSLAESPSLYLDVFRGKSPKYDKTGKQLILNQKCNRWNQIEIEHAKPVSDTWFKSVNSKFFTQEGDIIINSTGEGTIGRASMISPDFTDLLIDSHMLLLRLNQDSVLSKYFVYLINSKYGQDQINNLKSARSTNQTELGVTNLLKISFPLPNLSIQEKLIKSIQSAQKLISEYERQVENFQTDAVENFESKIFH